MKKTSELDPWRVICSELFKLSGYEIPEIIDKTGLVVDWSLTDRQNYSHATRKNEYRPRINNAYESLSEQRRLRVSHITVSELANRGKAGELTGDQLLFTPPGVGPGLRLWVLAQRLQPPLGHQSIIDIRDQAGAHRQLGVQPNGHARRAIQVPDYPIGRQLERGMITLLHRRIHQGGKTRDIVEGG